VIGNGIGGDGPEPAGRAPAPPQLRLVQDFVNSFDIEAGVDLFATPDGLRSWLLRRDLISSTDEVRREDMRKAVMAREAIRALVARNNEFDLGVDPAGVLNEVLVDSPLRLVFYPGDGARFEPIESGVAGALATILVRVHEGIIEGSWPRLKACRRDVCHWIFYDHSRNLTGRWCAMAICGNRTKTKAYYRRRHARAQSRT
jgi:predicted RNA-binding Zn ribbon-like protein